MEDLTIGDEKYVSSKKAAQITGYAKDYIGQLCREGRVEARLVGRNWYVRESAIRDHRFGPQNAPQNEEKSIPVTMSPQVDSPSWQAKYIPEDKPAIPPVIEEKKLEQKAVEEAPREEVFEEPSSYASPEEMQNAWQDWFSKTREEEESEPVRLTKLHSEAESTIESEPIEEATESREEPVKITPIAPPAPEYRLHEEQTPVYKGHTKEEVEFQSSNLALRASVIAVTLLIVLCTVIGSGIVQLPDRYSLTSSVGNYLSGTKIISK